MEEGKIFRLFSNDEMQKFEPIIITLFAMGPSFMDYKTRTATRKVASFNPINIPPDFMFTKDIVDKIIKAAITTLKKDDKLIPIEMFVNYYENGSKSTPAHEHGCKQISVSFGAPRPFKIKSKQVIMESGDALYLNQQLHSVPKIEDTNPFYNEPRISFNFFFTTLMEKRFDVYKKK